MAEIMAAKQRYNLTWELIADLLNRASGTLRRWGRRWSKLLPIRLRPGAKCVEPLSFIQPKLFDDLSHGAKRSRGSGALHDKLTGTLPRRRIQQMINEARSRFNQQQRATMFRIEWLNPMLAWAIDDTELTSLLRGQIEPGRRLFVNTIQELSTRYKFDTGIRPFLNGDEVAERLSKLFVRHGAPLILKRDNGSTLNAAPVNDLLRKYGVIALNSPPYYSRYNGAVEYANREIKTEIGSEMHQALRQQILPASPDNLLFLATNSIHGLNHNPRRSLQQSNSCAVFHSKENRVKFSKRRRQEISQDIGEIAYDLLAYTGSNKAGAATAIRLATETWLIEGRYITSQKSTQVLPDLSR